VIPQLLPPLADEIGKFLPFRAVLHTPGKFGIIEDFPDPGGKVPPLQVVLERVPGHDG
jgi:hypothetical protein